MNPNAPAPPYSKAADESALAPGQEVLEYRIDKVLGGGGFGITYLAQDVNLQLPVAIKEYFPSSLAVRAQDRSVHVRSAEGADQFQWGLERFIDEARALASFRHPNIVRVLRYFKDNGTAYIVMEYESGDPLKYWLNKRGALDQHSLLQIAYPLLDGLESVHKLNFLHRDIKPDNIYIRADGTPVLLDFGAARRLTSNHDMTNIVSPGFAPFEQYHSKGHQGPWTDLYSLGAVLYWMTTGSKPMESASRVRDDSMPKAAQLASRAAFGEQLLQAIDWAMNPDETQRPQTVDALRRAFQNSEHLQTQVMQTAQRVDSATVLAANALSVPINPEEAMRKNVMSTIMFLDLVAYSTYSVDQQVAIKTLFNEMITKAIGGVNASSRIMLDTGDGAAICFLGDPEEALQSALLLRDLILQKYGQKLSMRVGLHMGPVRMLMDINQRVNVVGDGINVAQRIMDFSTANQITVSRAYYDVISRISDGAEAMFEYLGPRLDKHKRSHEVYTLVDPNSARAQSPDTEFAHTAFLGDVEEILPHEIQAIEAELTRAIGPLAHVLVKKAKARAPHAQGLRELLSVSIQDSAAREAFVQATGGSSRLANSAGGPSTSGRNAATGGPLSQPLSRPATVPLSSGTARSATTTPSSATTPRTHTFSEEQQAQVVRALSQYIGPLSKTLVRKEAARQANFHDLLHALSLHIDKADERARFLSAAAKLQSRH